MAERRPVANRTVYAVLLRAVNVGGRTVRMTELRSWLEELTGAPVATYLQSGNAIVRSAAAPHDLESAIATDLTDRLGYHVGALARTGAELAALIDANPLARDGVGVGELHATVLAVRPEAGAAAALAVPAGSPEELALGDRVVYLRCPGGYGRTKLHNAFLERRLGVQATTRNWRTVNALAVAVSQED